MNVSPNRTRVLVTATNELIGSALVPEATVQFTISTRSMLPTLAPGDRVIARGLRADEPSVGDIVMIRAGQSWLAHRLVDRCEVEAKLSFMTQGDYCLEPDALWSSEQICGKIVAVRRGAAERSLESQCAQWLGALIAVLLRWRKGSDHSPFKTLTLRINSALVRIASWLAYRFVQ